MSNPKTYRPKSLLALVDASWAELSEHLRAEGIDPEAYIERIGEALERNRKTTSEEDEMRTPRAEPTDDFERFCREVEETAATIAEGFDWDEHGCGERMALSVSIKSGDIYMEAMVSEYSQRALYGSKSGVILLGLVVAGDGDARGVMLHECSCEWTDGGPDITTAAQVTRALNRGAWNIVSKLKADRARAELIATLTGEGRDEQA